MAATKKSTEEKAIAAPAEGKATTVKTEAVKTAEPVKATEKKPARKPAAKKTAAKKAPAKKKEVKTNVSIQFSGKSYSNDELLKIAKDVWKYDLKRKVGDLTDVELYVKPEESMVYYVFNGEEEGCFNI